MGLVHDPKLLNTRLRPVQTIVQGSWVSRGTIIPDQVKVNQHTTTSGTRIGSTDDHDVRITKITKHEVVGV